MYIIHQTKPYPHEHFDTTGYYYVDNSIGQPNYPVGPYPTEEAAAQAYNELTFSPIDPTHSIDEDFIDDNIYISDISDY
jgi:hypothetical protein